ncbi:MAG: (2Fe-2S)-binding protein [Chloroflexi bacterium]|nr:(2Fe-2S)-binding protein [Chloroflexota bacterium]
MTFTFDGRPTEGVEGEPVAASLLAADRLILSRSFRFHRPRGLMCSTGQCGWCECEVDGRPSVRTCRVPVREGLVVRGEHAFPSVGRDLLAALGIGSRWIPPTFYHHRFLRPRRLRKRYLDVLRWFGGRGRLRTDGATPLDGRALQRIEASVLVVGGGRAGLHAALGAAEDDQRVVLIEAEPSLGGVWRADRGDGTRGPSIEMLADEAAAAEVEILTSVTATGWYDGVVAAVGDGVAYEIRARAVVAATGSYEWVPLVPGADRPGVMGARTVAWLVDRHGIVPGDRILLVGGGAELADAEAGLRRAGGATIEGPIPTADLVAIRGRRRVTGAVIRRDGRERTVPIDVVVFSDRSPNLDLVLAAGGEVAAKAGTLLPVCDDDGRLRGSLLHVAGSAAGRPISDSGAAALARRTGQVAARSAVDPRVAVDGPRSQDPQPAARLEPRSIEVDGVSIVCFCEDVRTWEIRAEQRGGYGDPELLKRRTGALTGPCQGKYCLQAFALLAVHESANPGSLPTARPPLRPIRLGDLVVDESANVVDESANAASADPSDDLRRAGNDVR